MRFGLGACLALGALGCSGLTEGDGGVVAVEIRVPSPSIIEVGETLQLAADALNGDGQPVPDATITWATPDTTAVLDAATGQVTGRTAGQSARIQARVGSLGSALVALQVIAPADTLILVGDSMPVVAAGETATAPLVTRLESFNPAGPLTGRPVIYEVTEPAVADPAQRTVELSGGVLVDTVQTGADGQPVTPIALSRVTGKTAPATAVVVVRAERTRRGAVPGSGQRFVVRFE